MTLIILYFSTLIGGWLFPWWWPALIGYVIGFWFPKNSTQAFISGFGGSALSWSTVAIYTDWQNQHILAIRIAEIFHLPGFLGVLVMTATLGGIWGGLGTWSGFYMGAYIRPKFSSNP